MTVVRGPGGWSVPAEPPTQVSRIPRIARGDLVFAAIVVLVYVAVALFASRTWVPSIDRMQVLADRILEGSFDSPTFARTVDSVLVDGRWYIAVGPLQVVPYLPFALLRSTPLEPLRLWGEYVAPLLFGIPAALLALPLARAYGATGRTTYWIAGFTAFGSLLFFVSVLGNFYYLAHAESFLALSVLLLEWASRRRPLILGAAMAVSFLARPTTILAIIPLCLWLLWQRRGRLDGFDGLAAGALGLGIPIAIAVAAFGVFNLVRFGSPLESGYAISVLTDPLLAQRRALGVFSIAQVPENIRLSLLAGFQVIGRFPWLKPEWHGLSMLLVSPGLLLAGWAGVRAPAARILWLAALVVAVPVFLYYGGGFIQYGFRYSLDFTPFLIALVAMGTRRRFGRPEQALILFSIASVAFGVAWRANLFQ